MPSKGSVAAVQDLSDDLELTQFGEEGEEFRNALRVERGEIEMSLILGRQTPMAAALLVTKTAPPWAAARYTTVGQLRKADFDVQHSPTRGNALHVSVFPPSDAQGLKEWDQAMASSFDQCFTCAEED
ncbi:hypothetical protein HH310_36015 [Actinoplanes sp. TBRC 11911]|uniref:hypothetical protein n=1 Tax=Actinoplanes sp. TBRC 11911 TaxID=2729386 RepID=UPI00145C75B7|nr:hypothetical protein [Actinoplanes sp. TBRC 11911]NMO56568.1 hypothetical protein [Actinoplanes sp. TBRC 11911]